MLLRLGIFLLLQLGSSAMHVPEYAQMAATLANGTFDLFFFDNPEFSLKQYQPAISLLGNSIKKTETLPNILYNVNDGLLFTFKQISYFGQSLFNRSLPFANSLICDQYTEGKYCASNVSAQVTSFISQHSDILSSFGIDSSVLLKYATDIRTQYQTISLMDIASALGFNFDPLATFLDPLVSSFTNSSFTIVDYLRAIGMTNPNPLFDIMTEVSKVFQEEIFGIDNILNIMSSSIDSAHGPFEIATKQIPLVFKALKGIVGPLFDIKKVPLEKKLTSFRILVDSYSYDYVIYDDGTQRVTQKVFLGIPVDTIYEYLDKINGGGLDVPGFIKQQVAQRWPEVDSDWFVSCALNASKIIFDPTKRISDLSDVLKDTPLAPYLTLVVNGSALLGSSQSSIDDLLKLIDNTVSLPGGYEAYEFVKKVLVELGDPAFFLSNSSIFKMMDVPSEDTKVINDIPSMFQDLLTNTYTAKDVLSVIEPHARALLPLFSADTLLSDIITALAGVSSNSVHQTVSLVRDSIYILSTTSHRLSGYLPIQAKVLLYQYIAKAEKVYELMCNDSITLGHALDSIYPELSSSIATVKPMLEAIVSGDSFSKFIRLVPKTFLDVEGTMLKVSKLSTVSFENLIHCLSIGDSGATVQELSLSLNDIIPLESLATTLTTLKEQIESGTLTVASLDAITSIDLATISKQISDATSEPISVSRVVSDITGTNTDQVFASLNSLVDTVSSGNLTVSELEKVVETIQTIVAEINGGTAPAPEESNLGAIIGGCIGGVAFVALCIGGVMWYRKKKSNKVEPQSSSSDSIEV